MPPTAKSKMLNIEMHPISLALAGEGEARYRDDDDAGSMEEEDCDDSDATSIIISSSHSCLAANDDPRGQEQQHHETQRRSKRVTSSFCILFTGCFAFLVVVVVVGLIHHWKEEEGGGSSDDGNLSSTTTQLFYGDGDQPEEENSRDVSDPAVETTADNNNNNNNNPSETASGKEGETTKNIIEFTVANLNTNANNCTYVKEMHDLECTPPHRDLPTTDKFRIMLHPRWAPIGAERFRFLTTSNFWREVRIFRVVPRFVVQFGISSNPDVQRHWSSLGPIPDDPVLASNVRGSVTFATSGPNSRTTQLFINTNDNSFLDGEREKLRIFPL